MTDCLFLPNENGLTIYIHLLIPGPTVGMGWMVLLVALGHSIIVSPFSTKVGGAGVTGAAGELYPASLISNRLSSLPVSSSTVYGPVVKVSPISNSLEIKHQ